MNILDVIMNARDGAAVRQIGSQVGLGETQTASALAALVPALAAGLQQNTRTPDGLAGLAAALTSGNHQRYINDPAALEGQGVIAEGNGILGHVLGSKDVSRDVASRAAAQSGLSADVLKQLLPLAATLVMGALSQQNAASNAPGLGAAGGGGLTGMLTSLLDRDRDGSITDDLSGMLGRVFRS